MIKVAIYGASGYTGQELLRILISHPEAVVVSLPSRRQEGTPVSKVFPHLRGCGSLAFTHDRWPDAVEDAQVVFLALPHENAMELAPALLSAGKKVIDLSAAFRLRDEAIFSRFYGEHRAPSLLSQSVYGLPELYRNEIVSAVLVANPGCYPTSIILALAPLLKNGLVEEKTLIADSKSGVSGAGREAKVDSLFCEVNEGFKAYKVGEHRHRPEIEQELSRISSREIKITFTPHLLPVNRGILSTVYATLKTRSSYGEIRDLYENFYAGEPFVRVLPQGEFPNISAVRGTNICEIGIHLDAELGRITLISAIDNLVKGASGQAVQNMNILCGLPETKGLASITPYP